MPYQRTRFNRAVLCYMTDEQYEYVFRISEKHKISMSVAICRLLKLARTIEQMPDIEELEERKRV